MLQKALSRATCATHTLVYLSAAWLRATGRTKRKRGRDRDGPNEANAGLGMQGEEKRSVGGGREGSIISCERTNTVYNTHMRARGRGEGERGDDSEN